MIDLTNMYFSDSKKDIKKKIADSLKIISSQINVPFDPDSLTTDLYYNKASVLSTINNFIKKNNNFSDSLRKKYIKSFEEKFHNINEIDYTAIVSYNDLLTDKFLTSEYLELLELCETFFEYKDDFIEIFNLKKVGNLLKNLISEIYKKQEETYKTCHLKFTTISYFDILFSLKRNNFISSEIIKQITQKNLFKYENKYNSIYSSSSVLN